MDSTIRLGEIKFIHIVLHYGLFTWKVNCYCSFTDGFIAVAINIHNKVSFNIECFKNFLSFSPLLKLVYQNKNEWPRTSMAFTMIVSRFEKNHCLLKSSVLLTWEPNLIKTLATGAISKLTIQTREPIFPNTPSSILFAYYGHDISNMVYVSLANYFVMVFTNCGKWLGWNIIHWLASR